MIIIGVMSGTSLDGLDLAACRFREENNQHHFEILHAETVHYSQTEAQTLKSAFHQSGMQLIAMHQQFGKLIGQKVNEFCKQHHIKPDYIASHGHTIFHQPNNQSNFFTTQENPSSANQNPQHPIHNSESPIPNSQSVIQNSEFRIHNSQFTGYTFQLGHGAEIAAHSGIKTICDFRTSDVAYGGQGAPLVPIGDELLFSEYEYCLNLGGISNISFNENGKRKAFDIGICNMALNELAQQLNLTFDMDGLLAQSGKYNKYLFDKLLTCSNEHHQYNHSLGYEWYQSILKPIVDEDNSSIQDKLNTLCVFIASQIASAVRKPGKVLITGGGAKNQFLIKSIQQAGLLDIIIPERKMIDYKEALIFAFLGMLRVNEKANCLKEVTGASKNVIGGCIYLP